MLEVLLFEALPASVGFVTTVTVVSIVVFLSIFCHQFLFLFLHSFVLLRSLLLLLFLFWPFSAFSRPDMSVKTIEP